MIRGRWRDPNRRVHVTDDEGGTATWITWDESEAALRERLAPLWADCEVSDYDFSEWRVGARAATAALAVDRDAGDRLRFERDIWTELKAHLFDLFHGKCAYCEARVRHVDFGDVEHFRPKRRVKEDPTHPGYWWLAYDPENLLPSCTLCNRARGKRDRFPVVEGTRGRDPASLAGELPLLLNPYRDRPEGHLEFVHRGGVRGRTKKGRQSVRVLKLRRMAEERLAAQERLKVDLDAYAARLGSFEAACNRMSARLRTGRDQYCGAMRQHLVWLIEEQERQAASARRAVQEAFGTDDDDGDLVELK